jgi:hypothetical protein
VRAPRGFRVARAGSITGGIGIVVRGARMGVITMVLSAEHVDRGSNAIEKCLLIIL